MHIFNNKISSKNMGHRTEHKSISLATFCPIAVIRSPLMSARAVTGPFCSFSYKVCKNEVNLIKC